MKKIRQKYQSRKLNNRKGFTLAELLIAAGILAVLAAVSFVGILTYQRSLKLTEMDGTAREIFIAAQNHMTALQASGEWEQLVESAGGTNPTVDLGAVLSEQPSDMTLDDTNGESFDTTTGTVKRNGVTIHTYKVITSAMRDGGKSIIDSILPYGAIDESLQDNGSFLIEYDIDTATVYSVFYTDKKDITLTTAEYDFTTITDGHSGREDGSDGRAIRKKYKNLGNNVVVGYYGGAMAENLEKASAEAITVKVINTEKLTLEITDPNHAVDQGSNMVTVRFQGEESGKVQTWRLDTANADKYSMDASTNVYTVTLDDITTSGKHFAELFQQFIPGENLIIQVSSTSQTKLAATQKGEAYTNSLFESRVAVEGSTSKSKVTIANIRHLQNLSPVISRLPQTTNAIINTVSYQNSTVVTEAVQTKNISWTFSETDQIRKAGESTGLTAKHFLGITNGALTSYDAKNSKTKANFTISGLQVRSTASAPAGLFAQIGDAQVATSQILTVSNLTLEDMTVAAEGTGDAGVLCGNAGTSATLHTENVMILNSTVTAKDGAAGGLVGSMANGVINASAIYLTDTKTADGNVTKSAQEKYLEGTKTTGTLHIQSNGSAADQTAGGLIGKITKSDVTAKQKATNAYRVTVQNSFASMPVIANVGAAGGLVGAVTGTDILVTNSYAGGFTQDRVYKPKTGTNTYYNVQATGQTGIAGGMLGKVASASSGVVVQNSYSTCSVYGTNAGGFVGVDESATTYTNDYAVGLVTANTTTTGKTGTFAAAMKTDAIVKNCYYLLSINGSLNPVDNKEFANISGKSYKNLMEAEYTDSYVKSNVNSNDYSKPSAVQADDANQTIHYDVAWAENGKYPFALVNKTVAENNTVKGVQVGDWQEETGDFQAEVVYYEIYAPEDSKYTIGFYNKTLGIDTLQEEDIIQDGYAVLTDNNDNSYTVTGNGSTADLHNIENLKLDDGDITELTTSRIAPTAGKDGLDGTDAQIIKDDTMLKLKDGSEWYVKFMDLATVDSSSGTSYYSQFAVTSGEFSKYFYLNPHYAKSLIRNDADENKSTCDLALPNTIISSGSEAGNIALRTERQYSMMTQDLQNPGTGSDIVANSAFAVYAYRYYEQQRNLIFGEETSYVSGYLGKDTKTIIDSVEGSVAALAPIAAAENTKYKNNSDNAQDTCGFAGIYDGKGHTIRNLSINGRESNSAGMFGNTKAAIIRNVKLENISISGSEYVGSVVGSAAHGKKGGSGSTSPTEITNVSVENSTVTGTNYVGGFVGAGYSCVVNKTTDTNTVTMSNVTVNGTAMIGGVFGYIADYSSSFKNQDYQVNRIQVNNCIVNETEHFVSTSTNPADYGTGLFAGQIRVSNGAGNTKVYCNDITIANSNINIDAKKNSDNEFSAASLWVGVYNYKAYATSLGMDMPTIYNNCKVTSSSLQTAFTNTITSQYAAKASLGGLYGAILGTDKSKMNVILDTDILGNDNSITNTAPPVNGQYCDLGGLVGNIYNVSVKPDENFTKYTLPTFAGFTNANTYSMGKIAGVLTKAVLQDYATSNWSLLKDVSARYDGGLIGTVVNGSTLSNISVAGVNSDENTTVDTQAEYPCNLGGVVGRIQNNGISNISVKGTVDLAKVDNATNVGAFAGYTDNTASNCFTNVQLLDATVTLKGQNVGGLIGKTNTGYQYDGMNTSNSTITGISTLSNGGISTENDANKESNLGGIIGYAVKGSKKTGGVGVRVSESSVMTKVDSGFNNIGGAIGNAESNISDVSITDTTINGIGINIGGVLGKSIVSGTKTNLSANNLTMQVTGRNIGGLAGYHSASTMNNSSIGSIAITNQEYDTTGTTIGGAVGQTASGTITDITGNDLVEMINTAKDNAVSSYGGGLIGKIAGSTAYVNNISISGTVQATGVSYVGGAIGGATSAKEIYNITSKSLTAVATKSSAIGGVIGYSSKEVYESNAQDIIVSGENNVGGFAGYLQNASTSDCGVYLPTAAEELNVADYKVSGTGNVGGFVGATSGGTITNCFAAIPVSGTDSQSVTIVGGFAGSLDKGTVENCYASGDVANGTEIEGSFSGGFAGTEHAVITLKDCYATGDVSQGIYRGGFLGGLLESSTASMNNCYSLGAVEQSADAAVVASYEGGFVGLCAGNIIQDSVEPDQEMIIKFFQMLDVNLLEAYDAAVNDNNTEDAERYRNSIIGLMKRLSIIPQKTITEEQANTYVNDQAKRKTLKGKVNGVKLSSYLNTLNYSVDYGATSDVLVTETPSTAQVILELMNASPYTSINLPGWFIPQYNSKNGIQLYYLTNNWNYVYQSLSESEKTEFLKKSYDGYSYTWNATEETVSVQTIAIKFTEAKNENHNNKKPYLKYNSLTVSEVKTYEYPTGCVYLRDLSYNSASWADDNVSSVTHKTFSEMQDQSQGTQEDNYTYMDRLNQDTNIGKEIFKANPIRFVWGEKTLTHQYDPQLPDTYPFPALSSITAEASGTHWGDWPDNIDFGIVYYEKIQGDSTLYYHGTVINNYNSASPVEVKTEGYQNTNGLKTDAGQYVSEDGYLFAVTKGTVIDSNSVEVLCGSTGSSKPLLSNLITKITDNTILSSPLAVDYDLYYLNFDVATGAANQFNSGATKFVVSRPGSNNTKTFTMTPYFADSVVAGDKTQTTYQIRSARQLCNLQSKTDYASTAAYQYVQNMDISFDIQDVIFTNRNVKTNYSYSDSIANMNADYSVKSFTTQASDGTKDVSVVNGYQIKGVNACLFGVIGKDSKIQNVTLTDVDASDNLDTKLYDDKNNFVKDYTSGGRGVAFARTNNGTIESCVVRPSGKDYATNVVSRTGTNKTDYGIATAGFIWTNAGTINNCSFTGTVNVSSTVTTADKNAGVWVNASGFADVNKGTIKNSYANSNINVNTAYDATIGYAIGFCQSNREDGIIENCSANSKYTITCNKKALDSDKSIGIGFVKQNGGEVTTKVNGVSTTKSTKGTINNSYAVVRNGSNITKAFAFELQELDGYADFSDNYCMVWSEGTYDSSKLTHIKDNKGQTYDQMVSLAESNNGVASAEVSHPYDQNLTGAYPYDLSRDTTLSDTNLTMQYYGDWPVGSATDDIGLVYYEIVDGKTYYHGYTSTFASDPAKATYTEVMTSGTDLVNGLVTGSGKYVTEDGYLVLLPKEANTDDIAQIRIRKSDDKLMTDYFEKSTIQFTDALSDYQAYSMKTEFVNSSIFSSMSGLGDFQILKASGAWASSPDFVQFSMTPFFADSIKTGSVSNVSEYYVRSTRQLNNLRLVDDWRFTDNPNIQFIQNLDIDFTNSTDEFTQPIDSISAKFKTEIYAENGITQGYKIRGLKSNLFNTIRGTSIIQGITLVDSIATAEAGFAITNYGTIESCSIRPSNTDYGSVNITNNGSGNKVAGFVATNGWDAKIINSSFVGTLNFTDNSLFGSNGSMAGFATTNNGTIQACYTNSELDVSVFTGNSNYVVAGFCDTNAKTISDSHAINSIVVENTGAFTTKTGTTYGFSKTNNGSISDSYAVQDNISAEKINAFSGNQGSATGCYYYMSTNYNLNSTYGADGKSYIEMQKIAEDSGAIASKDVTHKYANSLPDIYPFAFTSTADAYLTMQHYGDWPEKPLEINEVTLAYYEKMEDGSIHVHGYDAAGIEVATDAPLSSSSGEYAVDSGYVLLIPNTYNVNGSGNVKVSINNGSALNYDRYLDAFTGNLSVLNGSAYVFNDNGLKVFSLDEASKVQITSNKNSLNSIFTMTPYFADSIQFGATRNDQAYYIRTAKQLNNLQNVNKGISFNQADESFVQTLDIDAKDLTANDNGYLIGTLQANLESKTYLDETGNTVGYTIDGLKIPFLYEVDTTSSVRNITLKNVNISYYTAKKECGTFARTNNGTIVGCGIRPELTGDYTSNTVSVSGDIAGFVDENTGTISDSFVVGTVTSTGGSASGFVKTNRGVINNSYANVMLNAKTDICGFVVEQTSETAEITGGHVLGKFTGSNSSIYGFGKKIQEKSIVKDCYVALNPNGISGNKAASTYLFSGDEAKNALVSNSYYLNNMDDTVQIASSGCGEEVRSCAALQEKQAESRFATEDQTHPFNESLTGAYPYALPTSGTDGNITMQHYGDWPTDLGADIQTDHYCLNPFTIDDDTEDSSIPELLPTPTSTVIPDRITTPEPTATVEPIETPLPEATLTPEPAPTATLASTVALAYRESDSADYEGWYVITAASDGTTNEAAPYDTLRTDQNYAIGNDVPSYGVLIPEGTTSTITGAVVTDEPVAQLVIGETTYNYFPLEAIGDHKIHELTMTTAGELQTFYWNEDFAAAIACTKTLGVTAEAGGTPYQIRTDAQLRAINTNREDYLGAAYRQTLDVVLSDQNFDPIGGVSDWLADEKLTGKSGWSADAFTGSYDGGLVNAGDPSTKGSADAVNDASAEVPANYRISNFRQTLTLRGVDGVGHPAETAALDDTNKYLAGGLFGYVTGQVRGIDLQGTISVVRDESKSYLHLVAGGLAGVTERGATIDNVSVDVNWQMNAVCSDAVLGGVVGTNAGTIRNSYYNGNFDGTLELQGLSGYRVTLGGFAGVNTGVIEKSAAVMTDTMAIVGTEEASNLGGFVGWTHQTVNSVTQDDQGQTVVVLDENRIAQCYSKVIFAKQQGNIGGFAGVTYKGAADEGETTVTDCYSMVRFDGMEDASAADGGDATRASDAAGAADATGTMEVAGATDVAGTSGGNARASVVGLFQSDLGSRAVYNCYAAEFNTENLIVTSSYEFAPGWDLRAGQQVNQYLPDGQGNQVFPDLDGSEEAAYAAKDGWELTNAVYPTLARNPERTESLIKIAGATYAPVVNEVEEDATP